MDGPLVLSPAAPPFAVTRAFGGVGVYRRAAVEGCRYECSAAGRCEHDALNACLRGRGRRLVVHPGFVVHWKCHKWCRRPGDVVSLEDSPPLSPAPAISGRTMLKVLPSDNRVLS